MMITRHLIFALLFIAKTITAIPCKITKTINDERPETSDPDKIYPTLSTTRQATYYRAPNDVYYHFTDSDIYSQFDEPNIRISSEECPTSSIFMTLVINQVSYTDSNGSTGVVSPKDYEDYNSMGGFMSSNRPKRGQYSPVYLEMPAIADASNNFETKLHISAQDLTYLPSPFVDGRVYQFDYTLLFHPEPRNQLYIGEIESF